jgi:hypothetical protein
MAKRTEHGNLRHEQGDRPTREAFHDRQNPQEIYLDLETGNLIYIGANGRTHFFTADGRHHTSFYTTRSGRQRRVRIGQWMRVSSHENDEEG